MKNKFTPILTIFLLSLHLSHCASASTQRLAQTVVTSPDTVLSVSFLHWNDQHSANLPYISNWGYTRGQNNNGQLGNGNTTYSNVHVAVNQGEMGSLPVTPASFTDNKVEAGKTYVYTLSDVDYSGKETMRAETEVEVEVWGAMIAEHYTLMPVYPNPFNASFTAPFTLNEPMTVSIALYNVRGQRVMNILNQELGAGEYHFAVNADELGSGVYFLNTSLSRYSRDSGTASSHTQRIVLMK